MFIVLLWFPIILGLAYLLSLLLNRKDLGPFTMFVNILGFIGVVVHELCHFVMCMVTGVPTSGFSVKYRSERSNRASPHGSVTPKKFERMTFLQAFLVGLAPLFICTWLIFFSLGIALNKEVDPVIRFFSGFFALSLFLTLSPSSADLNAIRSGFKRDPTYAGCQILIVLVSILIVWAIVVINNIIILDFVFYIIVGVTYYLVKYSFIGVKMLVRSNMFKFNSKRKVTPKTLTRKRVKPSKTPKKQRPQWW